VLPRVFAHAFPTASSTQPPTAVAVWKVIERLCLPATVALAEAGVLTQERTNDWRRAGAGLWRTI
jgi:hypothetical protein